MKCQVKRQTLGALLCGVVLGGLLVSQWKFIMPTTHAAQEQAPAQAQQPPQVQTPGQPPAAPETPAQMQADIARLNQIAVDQDHTMIDVGYHFTNLWFAAKQGNWPLAAFNFAEARKHIQWTVDIHPVRRLGEPVDLVPIWDSIRNGVLVSLKASIDQKDEAKFESTYKQTLTACWTCHQASHLPFLHPVVPTAPAQTIISFDPLPAE